MRKYIHVFIFILTLSLLGVLTSESLADDQPITQEQFAIDIVKSMDIEDLLPPAALGRDNVALLESIGISPLRGWRNKALLTKEDYMVIVAKASGKEGSVYKIAQQIEEKNIKTINKKWQQYYLVHDRWCTLPELFDNKSYFSEGAPQSPYGHKYQDRNHDHKVDTYRSNIAGLMRFKK